jgi:hypothetical protein
LFVEGDYQENPNALEKLAYQYWFSGRKKRKKRNSNISKIDTNTNCFLFDRSLVKGNMVGPFRKMHP